jgi:2'-5' RNA ligase
VEDLSPCGALASVASALEAAAREIGFEPESRPFRAHLTLARAEREGRPVAPAPGGAAIARDVRADEVVLFRSELGPGGARYSRIAVFPLGGEA